VTNCGLSSSGSTGLSLADKASELHHCACLRVYYNLMEPLYRFCYELLSVPDIRPKGKQLTTRSTLVITDKSQMATYRA
jgi:hypothetical protein